MRERYEEKMKNGVKRCIYIYIDILRYKKWNIYIGLARKFFRFFSLKLYIQYFCQK